MQNGQDLFEWVQDFLFSEFVEVLCLLTKKGGNQFDVVTALYYRRSVRGWSTNSMPIVRLLVLPKRPQRAARTRKRDDPNW